MTETVSSHTRICLNNIKISSVDSDESFLEVLERVFK
jgi:hypothetical protein